ncbi:MAG: carbohydrate ABC transporter permease [Chloroflexi bacterium]|nr:carbohydrate ABC transporter permease [Chloroflexota bacterium]
MTRTRGRRRWQLVGMYLLSALVLVFLLTPVWWILTTSIKDPADYTVWPPVIVPTRFSLEGWQTAFGQYQAGNYLRNSLIICGGATLMAMLVGTTAAYALVRFPVRGSRRLAFGILALRMFPIIALAIPLFAVFRTLGLLNTYLGLILAYQLLLVPFVVWMMRGFLADIPRELDEAALVDGCTPLGSLVRVVLPLTLPGLAATATFAALLAWNEFLTPLLFSQSARIQPVSMLVGNFVDPSRGIQWGPLSAVASVSILPMLLFALLLQKYLLKGLTMGAVKG